MATLCKVAKELPDNLKDYKNKAFPPNFFCTKCGRSAANEKNLCKTQKINNTENTTNIVVSAQINEYRKPKKAKNFQKKIDKYNSKLDKLKTTNNSDPCGNL